MTIGMSIRTEVYQIFGRLTKIQATTRRHHLWPEMWIDMPKAAPKQEKHEWAVDEPKLDNARKVRGIYLIDPEDGEYKETVKNARKKLEAPMEAATPCKMAIRKRAMKPQETVASGSTDPKKKSKYAFFVEAHESTRKRLESSLPRNHQDHIAEKGSIQCDRSLQLAA